MTDVINPEEREERKTDNAMTKKGRDKTNSKYTTKKLKTQMSNAMKLDFSFQYRIIFKTVWRWPLLDDLNYPIDWDRLGKRLSVTTTAHYLLIEFKLWSNQRFLTPSIIK